MWMLGEPPVLAPQIAPPTGVTSVREAATIHHEMQPESAVSNISVTVIEIEEWIEDSHPLPAGVPPPYSSLEFEQQPNENDEPEQLPPSYDEAIPPSYDEAVRGSGMALV
ncbi:hypothetical protein OS493_021060 [Desmophyllum pertusum]|uniref:Uncharacterized protein n=1 Tax=Desmophyllum pertusum TaxID=174260 RepID=A0A9X0A1D8_9CNID|nr:hypothetical protein OS493_021060 [Desmophyllum pertusum]